MSNQSLFDFGESEPVKIEMKPVPIPQKISPPESEKQITIAVLGKIYKVSIE